MAGYELQEPAPYDGSPVELFYRRVHSSLPGYERQEQAPFDGSPGELIDQISDSRLAHSERRTPLD